MADMSLFAWHGVHGLLSNLDSTNDVGVVIAILWICRVRRFVVPVAGCRSDVWKSRDLGVRERMYLCWRQRLITLYERLGLKREEHIN